MMKNNKLTSLISDPAPPSSSDAPVKLSKEQQLRDRKWRAEDALRTLIRAEEIRRDRALMRDVLACAAEQKKQLQSIGSRSGPR